MSGWLNGVSEGDPTTAEADRVAREQRESAALRYLDSLPDDMSDIKMMLGLIPSPPPGDIRREMARARARRQRERQRAEREVA